jgi:hypothetical protein
MSILSRTLMMVAICTSLALASQLDGAYRSEWSDVGPASPGPTDPNAPSG